MATCSSIVDWKIPWTEEPGGLQSMGSQKSWTQLSDETTNTHKHSKSPTYEPSILQTFRDASVLLPRYHWIIFSRVWIELNPARNQNLCHQHQAWVKLHLALHLFLLTILPLYQLPPPVSNTSRLFTGCRPLCASCCTVLLYFSRYHTIGLHMFS